jgi:3-deoxy-D-manno-octulosonate 8-phosphate phosphatase (KDO 8-P phosphatase)
MREKFEEKARAIRLAIFDVDGILTTGQLVYSSNGTEYKSFDVRDGLGMKLLQQSGVQVGIITSRNSQIVTQRMQDLGIQHVYQGFADKIPAYEALKQKLNLTDANIAYIGDDLPDLPLIRRAGLGITVPNAPALLLEHADWVTQANGGNGVAREVSEFIMQAQGTFGAVMESFLQR